MLLSNLFLLLLMSVALLVDSQNVEWTREQDACIVGNNDEIWKTNSLADCKARCLTEAHCNSIEFIFLKRRCHLSKANQRQNYFDFKKPCTEVGVIYTELIRHSVSGFGGNQGNGDGDGSAACSDFSHCDVNEICKSGNCVDPCESIKCGKGVRCQVFHRQPKCPCPDRTLVDPNQQCQPTQGSTIDTRGGNQGECTSNTNCGDNKVCRSGSCVNLCDLAKCGQGATCQLIHRRPQCICPDNTRVKQQVQCPTKGPSDCQFPFIYKDTTFSGCTRESDPEGKLWCSTKTDSQKNHLKGNWKHCTGCESAECGPGTNCMILQGRPHCNGTSPCKFPFNYKDNQYSACTNKDDKSGMLWCSIKTDNQNNHLKGNWKHCTANIGDRAVMDNPATNNQANLQFTKPPSKPSTNAHGQESARHDGCYSLPDPGECRGAFPRFYYNQQTDQCDCFLFGGCDEDRVKFTWLSFNECLGTCVPGNKTKGPGCQRVTLEEVQRFLEE